ncbi:GNAT family N-acetyltransferase [Bradyrhizobium canariense]|uniref:acyl-homoserine-lactone synthase n=1 Tax=Bradyrhizobium canariense TaxID=255045 RepID=UPI001CA5038E|nr:acyl-homoserine-lactone synthase [Bradyrhizobium canariense]MBW5439300.1 GNAT family N-acetyltransferase [Bradyrhizobium canariense]
MIHTVDSDNKLLYQHELEEHFRLRHRIYVDERKWIALKQADGREIDQFDTDEAIYLMALDRGHVIGGARLVPTLQPHLLANVFPFLANVEGIPRGPGIYEWTRIFVVPEHRGPNSSVLHAMLAGMMEYCLGRSITAITAVMETWWLPRFHNLDWDVKLLGEPADIDGMSCVGAMISVTEAAWRRTIAVGRLEAPVLHARCRHDDSIAKGVLPHERSSSSKVQD